MMSNVGNHPAGGWLPSETPISTASPQLLANVPARSNTSTQPKTSDKARDIPETLGPTPCLHHQAPHPTPRIYTPKHPSREANVVSGWHGKKQTKLDYSIHPSGRSGFEPLIAFGRDRH